MEKLLSMFFSFFKIGSFTFGGGYAMIPLIEKEVVDTKDWIDRKEFIDIVAIAQSFPGALAVNTSIFIGYKIGGVLGALLALLGTILPSFSIILILASFFMQFRDNYYVNLIFKGISAAVPMLVLIAVVSLSKAVEKNYINAIIIIASVISISVFKIHPVLIVVISGFYGYFFLRKKVDQ